jgi:hypothetical protein
MSKRYSFRNWAAVAVRQHALSDFAETSPSSGWRLANAFGFTTEQLTFSANAETSPNSRERLGKHGGFPIEQLTFSVNQGS